ncbi:MAG: HK97 gp10 family phage protein [Dehalococcoidia bacterium]|jgi:hypothetical protein
MIEFKVNMSELKADLTRMRAENDSKSKQCAEQILIEMKNNAHKLSLKDTNFMDDGIERASKVTRLAPSIYAITLGSDAEYASFQELGPLSGKRRWRFRPFIRPSVFVGFSKAREVCERVHGT